MNANGHATNGLASVEDQIAAKLTDTECVIFSTEKKIDPLIQALAIFQKYGVELTHIESRSSKDAPKGYDYFVSCNSQSGDLKTALDDLRKISTNVTVHQGSGTANDGVSDSVPWFPRKISDLDAFANRVLSAGEELEADHPGFTDQVYRQRRKQFADLAIKHRHGDPIPHVTYTPEETETWRTVYRELTKLYPTHACDVFNRGFALMQKHCGYREDNVPQLADISRFLKERTGFTLRPVAGLLSPRDFLAGLAFRVFHSTQYIRHGSKPMYTPEPDVCHELMGHVPLFADPSFAKFSHEIGLASLGAPEEYIKKLSTCYWFTIEFGLCHQKNGIRAYGAGLLSSFGELQYCLSDQPEKRSFDPFKTGDQEYPITMYQPIYYVVDSFDDCKEKMGKFANCIPRPFCIRYDAYTDSIEVLDNKDTLQSYASDVRADMANLENALKKYGDLH